MGKNIQEGGSMICLIIYIIISCQSTNYYTVENSGVKVDAFGKRGNYIDSSDYRNNNRIDYSYKEIEEKIDETFKNMEVINNGEVRNMEDMNSILTALGSAIAGIYCLVKTIVAAIKKIKKS